MFKHALSPWMGFKYFVWAGAPEGGQRWDIKETHVSITEEEAYCKIREQHRGQNATGDLVFIENLFSSVKTWLHPAETWANLA